MTIPRPDNIADIGDIADSKARLRQQMRARRRQIPPAQQAAAAEALCQRVIAQDFFTQAQHIAFYSATDGEINPRPLLEAALKAGKRCYLPIVPAISPPTGTVLHPAVGADTAP